MRSVSSQGVEFIQQMEGFSPTPYKDGGGVWTIGYGHVIRPGESLDTITLEQGKMLLIKDLAVAEEAVTRNISVKLNEAQFCALVSFAFNVGGYALKTSTLKRVLNAGDYSGVPAQLDRWVFDNKQKIKGLVNRRKAEGDLFINGFPNVHA